MKSPKLTIVLPTYNAQKDLIRFFTYFRRQKFPKAWVELLILDGGSTDQTVEISKANGARVIYNPHKLTEPGVALGFSHAKGQLIMVLAADNLFPDPNAIQTMIDVFDDEQIAAAFPKQDTGPGDSIYSRYTNTFTDPFTYFVYEAASNARTFHKIYETTKHTSTYDVYDYRSNPVLPIIALAQGFTIRRHLVPPRKEISDDLLTVHKLIQRGNSIAYVYAVNLYHYTVRDVTHFIFKLRRGVENALLREDSGITKRGIYLTTRQRIRMYVFFPYALTIVVPLLQSVINAVRDGEWIWLTHAYIVFLSAIVILGTAVSLKIKKFLRRLFL